MHSTAGELGGDLQSDTITIIGATLDLQEKVVRQAMTPLDKTFMVAAWLESLLYGASSCRIFVSRSLE